MKQAFETAAFAVEALGIAVLLIGLVLATLRFLLRTLRPGDRIEDYHAYRKQVGRALLLSIEILIGADIIFTVTVSQTLESLGMLALLVLIRTFLGFSLELEVSGRWPWQGRPDPD